MEQGKDVAVDMRDCSSSHRRGLRTIERRPVGSKAGFMESSSLRREAVTEKMASSVPGGAAVNPRENGCDDDKASESSDFISLTLMDIDGHSPTVTEVQEQKPTSPVEAGAGTETENEFIIDFRDFDDASAPFGRQDFHHQNLTGEHALQARLQTLRATIRTLRTEKQIAEERADLALERLAEIKKSHDKRQQQQEDTSRGRGGEDTIESLREQNRLLKEQLSDAQSHIFSLQPYRKELTPEEIGSDYDGLLEKVQDWAQTLMKPYLDDHQKGVHQVLSMAKKNNAAAMSFKGTLRAQADLVHAINFPETDEDILVALVLRDLHDSIFQKIVYGALDQYTDVLNLVETQMQTSVEPKRDLFSVRNWTAEAYNALISAPKFHKVREVSERNLTMKLAHKLGVLCRNGADWDAFCRELSEMCIRPAMRLYEKMHVSTHHFYLDVNPMMHWQRDGARVTSPEFYDSLGQLDCRNVLRHRKVFSLDRMDPVPSRNELRRELVNVCTVTPALYMRKVGQRDAIKEPTVVRKQQVLVAWGPEEKRKAFLEDGERPILSYLYFAKEKAYAWN